MATKQMLSEWIENNPPVDKWMKKLEESTRIGYCRDFYRFVEYLKTIGGLKWTDSEGNDYVATTPEELLKAQDELQGQGRKKRYKILDLVQDWIRSQNLRVATKRRKYHLIRSFFKNNRVPLPEDTTFKPKGDKPSVQRLLTVEDLQKLVLSSNELYQAVMLIQFQGAMGVKEIIHFSDNGWTQIKPQLESGEKIIRIDFPGRKHSVYEHPYYTFIGKDAIDAINRYLKIRGNIKNGEAIFLSKNGEALTGFAYQQYFKRHMIRTGVVKAVTPECPKCGGETRKKMAGRRTRFYKKIGSQTRYICNECDHAFKPSKEMTKKLVRTRYKVSPHELRDLFRSCWETSPVKGIVAEFLMGHAIDPNNYNKFFKTDPGWVASQYRLAMPWLNIISEDPRKIPIDEVSRLTEKTRDQNGIIAQQQEEIEQLKQKLAMKEQENNTTKEDINELKKQFEDLKKYVMEKKD